MSEYDIEDLGGNAFLIRSGESDFHRNIYIKRFVAADGARSHMIFDPGTRLDLPALLKALDRLIGGISALDIVFLSHQDPDVSSNIGMILASAPRAILITSIDTWRLVRMYGISEKRFFAIENMKSDPVRLRRTGHRLSFLPIPFAHFKGAMMVYDHESGILFSGDFLGGLNTRNRPGIMADEDSWEGISLFHQIYIPSNRAVLNAVGRIGMLARMPRLIAPQHGDVIPEKQARLFLDRLTKLNVGLDLEQARPRGEIVQLALNAFLKRFRHDHGDLAVRLVETLRQPGNFTTLFGIVDDAIMEMKISDQEAIPRFWEIIRRLLPTEIYPAVAAEFLDTMEEFGLSVGDRLARELNPDPPSDDVFS